MIAKMLLNAEKKLLNQQSLMVLAEIPPSRSYPLGNFLKGKKKMNQHVLHRLYDRVVQNGVPLVEAHDIVGKLEKVADSSTNDIAILIYQFARQQVSDLSNGEEVWAIIRNHDVKTIMLRRGSQPKTAWSLRVDKVVLKLQ
jgi:argininosuccinate lyase